MSEQQLTGTELHKAVVRKRWPDPYREPNTFRVVWRLYNPDHFLIGKGATEDEAWHAAALRVLEEAGYTFNITNGRIYWLRDVAGSIEKRSPSDLENFRLAQEAAMRDYVGAATQPVEPPKPEAAGDEQLTGMALDQAVVRVKWAGANIQRVANAEMYHVCEDNHPVKPALTSWCATEPEAWANAADKVIGECYEFQQAHFECVWFNKRDSRAMSSPSRALALEHAKRDYIARESQPAEPPKPDAAGDAIFPPDGELVIVHHKSSARYLIAYRKHDGWWDNSDDGPVAQDSVAAWDFISAPHSRDQSDLRESQPVEQPKPDQEAVVRMMADALKDMMQGTADCIDSADAALAAYKELINGK